MRKATNSNDILCPICLDNLITARSLPCLHTFCERCLGDHIRNSLKKVGEASKFNCPTCEKETLLPSSGTPIDNWEVHFPYDRILMSMLPDNKDKVNQLCESCMKGGKQEPADSFCINCREALCRNCVRIHNNVKLNHSFIIISDSSCRSDMAIGISMGVKCSRHIHKDLEYFCRSHEETCCSDCLLDHLGTCKETLALKKHSSVLLKPKKAEHLTENINKLTDYLDNLTQTNKSAISKIESETKSMVDRIDSLISLLQNTKSRIIKEREEFLERESLMLQEKNMHYRSLKVSLLNSLKSYEEVCKYGDSYECFVILHKVEEQIVQCENILQKKYSKIREVQSNLETDYHFNKLFKMDASKLAMVMVRETMKTAPRVPRIARSSPLKLKENGNLQSPERIQLTMSSPILDFFRPPAIKRLKCIEFLPGNKLILVSDSGSKAFCHVLDLQTNRYLAHHHLSSTPWDLCVMDKVVPLVAVTFPLRSEIQVFSIQGTESATTISIRRTIDTHPRRFYGVSALSPNQLAVSGKSKDKCYWGIASITEGNLDSEHNICDRTMFSFQAIYLATSQDKSRVYISCGAGVSNAKPAMYCFSVANGERIFKYQHPDLTYSANFCVDGQNNIYICNRKDPGSIWHITGEGELIQVFHSGIPKEPIAICFDEKEKELFVTSCTESDTESKITRFRLEQ